MTAILRITDGTTEINLIQDNGNAFHLNSWRPAIAQLKGGGTWQQSALSDGRRLVDYRRDNVVETFDLRVKDVGVDELVLQTQKLRRLLDKASDYWATDWQDTPVYLIVQAGCETNPRYAIIYAWSTPDDENPFAQPFLQPRDAMMNNWTLSVERGHWTENAPGTGVAIEISNSESYDGRSHGRAATTANEVYVANKRNIANLTDIYYYDASGPAWSANLMDAALPFPLTPAVPAGTDITYFGIDTAVADSGPFCSLVFDLSPAPVPFFGIWEYWDSAAWQTIPNLSDNTTRLTATGVNSVHWFQPDDWDTCNLFTLFGGTAPNLTAWYVRLRITTGAAAAPEQQNRDVYTITWPYIEIQTDQVGGDITAIGRLRVYNQSSLSGVNLHSNRIIAGMRSVSRGVDFTAYLNTYSLDEQNPAGVGFVLGGSTNDLAAQPDTVVGGLSYYNPAGVEALAMRLRWTLNATLAPQWYGIYHAFLRGQRTGGDLGDIGLQLRVYAGSGVVGASELFRTDIEHFLTTDDWEAMDLGRVIIAPGELSGDDVMEFLRLEIWAESTVGGPPDINMYDLVLIPVDEWAMDVADTINTSDTEIASGDYLDIDSIIYPKRFIRSLARRVANDRVFNMSYVTVANGPVTLQHNSRLRLWFLAFGEDSSERSYAWVAHRLLISKQSRYLSMRGDR